MRGRPGQRVAAIGIGKQARRNNEVKRRIDVHGLWRQGGRRGRRVIQAIDRDVHHLGRFAAVAVGHRITEAVAGLVARRQCIEDPILIIAVAAVGLNRELRPRCQGDRLTDVGRHTIHVRDDKAVAIRVAVVCQQVAGSNDILVHGEGIIAEHG